MKGNHALKIASERRMVHALRRAQRIERIAEAEAMRWVRRVHSSILLSAESPSAHQTNIRRILTALNSIARPMIHTLRPQLEDMLDWGFASASRNLKSALTAKQKQAAATEAEQPGAGQLHQSTSGASATPNVGAGSTVPQIDDALFPPIPRKRAEVLLKQSIWGDGLTWEQRLSGMGRHRDFAGIAETLASAVAEGENVERITRRLATVVDGPVYSARRIARTESLRVAELGQRESWRHVDDLIEAVQVIATLDSATRPSHEDRNERIYRRQPDGSFVADNGDLLPQLPDEPNCRCFSTPILGDSGIGVAA